MVKFIKSPTGAPFFLAYNTGDEAELVPELEAELIEAKIAEEVKPGKKAAEKEAAAKAAAEKEAAAKAAAEKEAK